VSTCSRLDEPPLSWPRYGTVLSKDKNEEEAMRWLVRSIHLYPMNWGCWQEMTSLIGRVEDVSFEISNICCYADESIAQPNSSASTTEYHVLHIPPSYIFGALPIHA
jgi:hypothetical protein